MTWSKTALAGCLFGACAIGGGAVILAISDPGDDGETPSPFTSAELTIFDGEVATEAPAFPPQSRVAEQLANAEVYKAIEQSGVTGYVAQTGEGAVCAVVSQRGTYGMGCGDMDEVAAGRVVLELQFTETDPVVLLGVVPNDVDTVTIAGEPTTVTNNVWLAIADAPVESFTLGGGGSELTVHLDAGQPPGEGPAPGG